MFSLRSSTLFGFVLNLLLLLCLLLPSAKAESLQNKPFIHINAETFSQRISEGLPYIEDNYGQLSIDDAASLFNRKEHQIYQKNTLQFGYSESVYWLMLPIRLDQLGGSSGQRPRKIFVSVQYPLLDSVKLFTRVDGVFTEFEQGDLLPFHQRTFNQNNFVFPLEMHSNETTVYLRIESSSTLSIPLFVETEKSFIESEFESNNINGIYFGIAIGLAIYNFFLWLGTRRPVYILYVFTILNLILFNASMMGYSYYWWPSANTLQQIGIYLFSLSSALGFTLFGMSYLQTKARQPKWHQVLKLMVAVQCISMILVISSSPAFASKLNGVVMLVSVASLFFAAIRSYIKGFGPAKYYFIGQGAVLFSVVFTVLTSQGYIELYYLAPSVMKWSSAFELVFFSVGLADILNNERRLREQAQEEAARAREKVLRIQQEQNEALDTLVRERTEELEIANLKLQELNSTDELTGLRNRRHLNEVLVKEYLRSYRDKKPISILMLDIDFFKRLNDTYGHQFGDECLIEVAKVIMRNIRRPPDIAVRYGGEEFAIVLPATDLAGAEIVAENIRQSVESTRLSYEREPVSLTISIGVASEIPKDRENYNMLLSQADMMLYQAKNSGKNTVIS